MELYRVYHIAIQQLDVCAASLHPSGAYILIDPIGRNLGVWSGSTCRNVDRLLAETIGAKIMQTEFRKHTTNDCHIMRNGTDSTAPPPFYLDAIRMSASEFMASSDRLFKNSITNDSNKLFEIDFSGEGVDSPTLTLLEDRSPEDHGGRFVIANIPATKILLTECGAHDRKLWIGGKANPTQVKAAKSFLQRERGSFTVIKENMEPLLFKEKFANINDAFGRKSIVTHSPAGKLSAAPPIDTEVLRMVDRNFGSLAMLGDPVGPVGDSSRGGLHISLATDAEGALKVYRVCVDGSARRTLEECYSGPQDLIVLSSTRAYAVIYTCKNASRAFAYLWVGDSCAADAQAALALRCKEVFPPGVSPDQLQLQQGREPALLLKAVSARREAPLCVLSPRPINDDGASRSSSGSSLEICLESSVPDTLLPDAAPLIIHVGRGENDSMCSRVSRVYITAALDRAARAVGGNSISIRSLAVRVVHGADSSAAVRNAASRAARGAADIVRVYVTDGGTNIDPPSAGCKVTVSDHTLDR
jgi:hypothetical protein